MLDLTGRKIIGTGATSGIGRATLARLRGDGAAVRSVDRVGRCDVTLDVTVTGASETILSAAHESMGGVDGWFGVPA